MKTGTILFLDRSDLVPQGLGIPSADLDTSYFREEASQAARMADMVVYIEGVNLDTHVLKNRYGVGRGQVLKPKERRPISLSDLDDAV